MALNTPPDAGTFRYVLRTIRAYNPSIPRLASTYEESAESRDITHPDGIRHPTVFINTETARDALTKRGWQDVTDLWFDHYGAKTAGEETTAVRRRVSIKA